MRLITVIVTLLFFSTYIYPQSHSIKQSGGNINIMHKGKSIIMPAFSLEINGNIVKSNTSAHSLGDKCSYSIQSLEHPHATLINILISNKSEDTLSIGNFVPFGFNKKHLCITSKGPPSLARARLFLPGRGALNITLPDNAWELGYSSIQLNDNSGIYALSRRAKLDNGKKRRYKSIVYPHGELSYNIWIEDFIGDWRKGLKKAFQERWIYDLKAFDDSLYTRIDQQWIRHCYLISMQFAWDHNYFDYKDQSYGIYNFLDNAGSLGYYDIYCLWPTWPRLGLDQKNQWDMYRSLPGGLNEVSQLADELHRKGNRFFIAYNPWDQSTRKENHYQGMAAIIAATDADGLVLDTRGRSNSKLQRTADSIKKGVIMYSEGMAVPENMPGIISGRVHDAIYFQPVLNMNKLIRPDFALFRVCQLSEGRIRRECAISFFNGYGTEINTFAPGRPSWINEDYRFLGKSLMILRENSDAFCSYGYTPLISSMKDSIWINKWQLENKTIYTILSMNPKGHRGRLFEAESKENIHYVDLWNHHELKAVKHNDKEYISIEIPPYPSSWRASRKEGEVACIASFKKHIILNHNNDTLSIDCKGWGNIRIWKGNPEYEKKALEFSASDTSLKLHENLGRYEGKVVVQAFSDDGMLIDEAIFYRKEGQAVLISENPTSSFHYKNTKDMQWIPPGDFIFYAVGPSDFIPYPDNADSTLIKMPGFYMDRYPVTNAMYKKFIRASSYQPEDSNNYLKHWHNGTYLSADSNKPVVYVSHEDANAYASWAGKRLPTEAEWQYAAQGTKEIFWPWGMDYDSTLCNNTGIIADVGNYPDGESPFGIEDLCGNVWQMTADIYDNGSYSFNIIRGGSYYKPTSSWWYIKGGPQQLNKRQMLLLVNEGLNRNATVGFRCIMDSQSEKSIYP